jgi:non-ribosomal peptide synthetase component F
LPAEPPLTYFDWARRQRDLVSGAAGAEAGGFWAEHLADVADDRPELAWAEPDGSSGIHAERLRQELDERRSARLDATAAALGVSAFSLLLATFRRLAGEHLDGRPRAIGSSVANRELGTQDIVGMFVNVLPLHRAGDPEETVRDSARAEMSLLDRASRHQWLPTAEIVRRVAPRPNLGFNPLYQVMFSQHDAPLPRLRLGSWRPEVHELPNGYGKVDLDVIVRNRSRQHARSYGGTRATGPYSLHWYHDPGRYPRHIVRGLQARFERLLDSACRNLDRPWPTSIRLDPDGVRQS